MLTLSGQCPTIDQLWEKKSDQTLALPDWEPADPTGEDGQYMLSLRAKFLATAERDFGTFATQAQLRFKTFPPTIPSTMFAVINAKEGGSPTYVINIELLRPHRVHDKMEVERQPRFCTSRQKCNGM